MAALSAKRRATCRTPYNRERTTTHMRCHYCHTVKDPHNPCGCIGETAANDRKALAFQLSLAERDRDKARAEVARLRDALTCPRCHGQGYIGYPDQPDPCPGCGDVRRELEPDLLRRIAGL